MAALDLLGIFPDDAATKRPAHHPGPDKDAAVNSSVAFWNRRAAKYAAQPIADPAAYTEKLARTQRLLTPDMDVLEFGCGTGGTALAHAPHVRTVFAIDSSEEMIGIARARAEEAGVGNVRFQTDSIETLNATDASFDVVLGMSILHLVSDRDVVIDKVRRLLRPGGHFVSSTACLGRMPAPLRWIMALGSGLRLIPEVRFFSAEDLTKSLESAGFVIADLWQPKPGAAVFIIAGKS